MEFKMPTVKQWNSMIERTALDRFAALDVYVNQTIELEGKFIRLGCDKKTGIDNMHVLMENVYFKDGSGESYTFSHIWLNKAGIYFWSGTWYYNPIWFQIKQNDFIKIRGMVKRYYDNKNKALKNTLVNVVVLSVNDIRIAL